MFKLIGLGFLFDVPYIILNATFTYLLMTIKRVEIMLNTEYTVQKKIFRELEKQICLTRLILMMLLLVPLLNKFLQFLRLRHYLNDQPVKVLVTFQICFYMFVLAVQLYLVVYFIKTIDFILRYIRESENEEQRAGRWK